MITIGWLVNRHFGWPHSLEERRLRQLNLTPEMTAAADEYRARLEALNDAELERLRAEEQKKAQEEEAAKVRIAEARRVREAAEREARLPYNIPADEGTYQYWSKASYWTLDEAIILACGRRPDLCNFEHLRQNRQVSAFAGEFARLRELARRAVAMKQLYDPVVPSIFLAWALRLELPVAPTLIAAVEARGMVVADWQSIAERAQSTTETYRELADARERRIAQLEQRIADLERALEQMEAASPQAAASSKPLGTRERESLLKLVIGMAVRGYGYDPAAARNEGTADIANDLDELGISLDVDTVRKWLKEGVELLPQDGRDKA